MWDAMWYSLAISHCSNNIYSESNYCQHCNTPDTLSLLSCNKYTAHREKYLDIPKKLISKLHILRGVADMLQAAESFLLATLYRYSFYTSTSISTNKQIIAKQTNYQECTIVEK